jgi:murein L,D-transpeptidase YafK
MTDALIEEIYALARESFKGGQPAIEVHAFPFRMTQANMDRHKKHKWAPFWATLKQGYDHFEQHRLPPTVAVCERKYVVNVSMPRGKPDPMGACPAFERPEIAPFTPKPGEQQIAEERVTVPGPKTRTAANGATEPGIGGLLSGLTGGGALAPAADATGSTRIGFGQ